MANPSVADLKRSFELHLRAENKAVRMVETYLDALQLAAGSWRPGASSSPTPTATTTSSRREGENDLSRFRVCRPLPGCVVQSPADSPPDGQVLIRLSVGRCEDVAARAGSPWTVDRSCCSGCGVV
jgi:hypothetical protein